MKTLSTASWCALSYGLIAGFLRLTIDKIVPPVSPLGLQSISPDILWIAPLLSLPLFLLVGLFLSLLFRAAPWVPEKPVTTGVFVFLSVLGWLLIPAQISRVAAITLASGLTVIAIRWSAKRGWPIFSAARTLPEVIALVILVMGSIVGHRHWQEWRAERALPAAAGQPNVLLIVVDTLRADHTSAYGYSRRTTPALESIAREGVTFSQAISSSSWTLPSHIALMTGLAPDEANSLHRPLDPSKTTLAEILRSHGYRTGGFVANTLFGNRNMGLANGFIHYEDFFHSVEDAFNRTTFGSRILSRFYSRFRPYDYPGRRKGADLIQDFWSWVDDGSASRRPFFAFLNLIEAHHPYYMPEDPDPGSITKLVGIQHRQPANQDAYSRWTSSKVVEEWETNSYDRAVQHIDTLLNSVQQGLRDRGLAENTLLVITSDHGEALFEHQLFGHGKALYRNVVHVPLVVRFPGRIPAGIQDARPVSSANVGGLILDLLDARGNFPGPALLPLGQEPGVEDSAASFLEANPWGRKEWPNHSGWVKSVVTGRWHLITYEDGRSELFDWKLDPAEENNLSETTAGKTVVASLRPRLPAADNSKLALTQSGVRRGAE